MSPGLRPTSLPTGILIHPAVWPQQTWAENWGVCPPFLGGAGSPCHNVAWVTWATCIATSMANRFTNGRPKCHKPPGNSRRLERYLLYPTILLFTLTTLWINRYRLLIDHTFRNRYSAQRCRYLCSRFLAEVGHWLNCATV